MSRSLRTWCHLATNANNGCRYSGRGLVPNNRFILAKGPTSANSVFWLLEYEAPSLVRGNEDSEEPAASTIRA
jgi:hypothetical protein